MAASSSSAQPSRRLPPPCWTHDETGALIDAYCEKWYSLSRGNLRASHWQEVADSVRLRCHFAAPSKTSVQCRHKIEKLRKRYRSEKQRFLTTPNRSSSPWVFFQKMDSMEKGPSSVLDSDEDDSDDDDDGDDGIHGGGVGGFRVKIPGGVSLVPPVRGFRSRKYGGVREKPNPNLNPNPNPRFLNGCSSWGSGFGRKSDDGGGKREMDPVAEMVSSIKMLGEGFVKMEQMKMETAREIEKMRMEMEMKRTEMILESQQRIVDAFFSEKKKKVKRIQSPDS
ncbi:hypothetical protein HHK36_000440 [Tetracentron sinense]|uniref:Myb-like domain-containing protein n=1 Tax=Tetracentron sinense TaxID=13715 RepID=A0A835A107_TETSI|nr:hypothetical protein HHK36_000440 [Tetracentron sinense]